MALPVSGKPSFHLPGVLSEGGREMLSPAVGVREGTDCREHRGSHANNESLNMTSKTNDVLFGD